MKRTKQLKDARGEYSPLVQPYSIVDDKGKQVLPGLIKKVDTLATESKSFITKDATKKLIDSSKLKSVTETTWGDNRYNYYSLIVDTNLDTPNDIESDAYKTFVVGEKNKVNARNNTILGSYNTNLSFLNTVIGDYNIVDSNSHFVFGSNNLVNLGNDYRNAGSVMLGHALAANGLASTAIGNFCYTGTKCFSVGMAGSIELHLTGNGPTYNVSINNAYISLNDLKVDVPLSNTGRYYSGDVNLWLTANEKIVKIKSINTTNNTITLSESLGTLNNKIVYCPLSVNKGMNNVLIGNSIIDTNDSYCIGELNKVYNGSCYVIGLNNVTNSGETWIFGRGLQSNVQYGTVLGRYNELNPNTIRPFVIGQGTNNTNRKDILWSDTNADIHVKQKLYVAEDKEVATKEDVTMSIDNKFVVTDSIDDSDIEEGKIYLIY